MHSRIPKPPEGERHMMPLFGQWNLKLLSEPCKAMNVLQDHERCLWQVCNLRSLRKAKCRVVKNYPKHSPDESYWKLLRARLRTTEPRHCEPRPAFFVRLETVVNWLNTNRSDQLLSLCANQKQRAMDVKFLESAKSEW